MTSPDDSQCPYCGCPVLSAHANHGAGTSDNYARQVRRIWDDPSDPLADKVVPLPVEGAATAAGIPREPSLRLLDGIGDTVLWGLLWLAVSLALGVAGTLETWAVFGLAMLNDLFILSTYQSRPWFVRRRPQQRRPARHVDPAGSARRSRVSQV
jgi:hypothetical protein